MYGTRSSTCQGTLERPRYFPRQLVTPAELNLESRYFVDRIRRHNRMLHGWGVVCGAQVCRVPTSDGTAARPWKVAIRPGFLIDGYGNEIEIQSERIVDLRSTGVTAGCGDPPGEVHDPWCSDVPVEREPGKLWLAVCHRECLVRPVRTQPTGCDCDDTSCEYSRWQDGYEVHFRTECPETHQGPPPDPQAFLDSLTGPLRQCPDCPEDPCVVLAAIEFDEDGTITAIDNCSCRRMVVSFSDFWWRCAGGRVLIDRVAVTSKGDVVPGATDVRVVAKGENLSADADAELGEGARVTAKTATANGRTLTLMVDIDEDAAAGERTLTVTGDDCSTMSFPKAITIESPAAAKK
jgi:hypothetical protein